jgi:hypothetical protein
MWPTKLICTLSQMLKANWSARLNSKMVKQTPIHFLWISWTGWLWINICISNSDSIRRWMAVCDGGSLRMVCRGGCDPKPLICIETRYFSRSWDLSWNCLLFSHINPYFEIIHFDRKRFFERQISDEVKCTIIKHSSSDRNKQKTKTERKIEWRNFRNLVSWWKCCSCLDSR